MNPDHSADTVRPQFLAMNIVNQLFDLAEVPVEKRQAVNDEADAFVYGLLERLRAGDLALDGDESVGASLYRRIGPQVQQSDGSTCASDT